MCVIMLVPPSNLFNTPPMQTNGVASVKIEKEKEEEDKNKQRQNTKKKGNKNCENRKV